MWFGADIAKHLFTPPTSERLLDVLELAMPGEIGLVLLVAAFAQRRRRMWCSALVVPAVGMLSYYLPVFNTTFQELIWACTYLVATLLLLICGVILVRWKRQPRHWLHWSGVVSTALLLLGMLALAGTELSG